MSAPMNTDAAVLAQQAANFDSIAAQLNGVINEVQGTAGALQTTWRGAAGAAAQQALERFNAAAVVQQQALTEISNNINVSGTQYTSTDEDQTAAVLSAMGDYS